VIVHTIHAGNIVLPDDSRILDVGCGQDPVPEASVLLDRYLNYDGERLGPLRTLGKPFVLADMHYLPFKDKSFDFIVSQGVVEHAENPALVCTEFSRVSHAGVMTLPTQLHERISAWRYHKWFCVVENDVIHFIEKPLRLFPMRMEGEFLNFYHSHPGYFTLVYRWEDGIKYKVINFSTEANFESYLELLREGWGIVGR